MALAVALAAIVVVGGLIAGAWYSSNAEYRAGRSALGSPRAAAAAELGLNSIISSWTPTRTFALKAGAADSLADTTFSDGTIVKRKWLKLSESTFWIVATATTGGTNGQTVSARKWNALLHISTPEFKIMGAVTARGRDTVSGSDSLNGTDKAPTNWDCPPAGPTAAGLVVNDSTNNAISSGNCKSGSTSFTCAAGNPPVKDSTTLVADTTTFSNFGGFNYDSLSHLVDGAHTFSTVSTISQAYPRVNGTSCDMTQSLNWGDTVHAALTVANPLSLYPCQNYYPVVWLQGATNSWSISGKGGQGILLVDGNLALSGGFTWTGLIIVKGNIAVSGTSTSPVKITGAIMAMNRNGGTNTFKGNAVVQFSRCAIQTVSAKYSTAAPLKYRAFADLYQ